MTDRTDLDTQRAYARLAGFMYLIVLASSIAGLIVMPTLTRLVPIHRVSSDVTRTMSTDPADPAVR